MKRNIYAIIDGQAGSCGKGKVVGQFAIEKNIDVAIANCMPNAGHTFSQNGKRRIFRSIPVSAVNPNTVLFMGAGTVIDMDVLEEEYENNKDILDGREIIVHPMVPIIEKRHINKEKEMLRSGSTFKGGGACLAEKIMRSPETKFFKEYKGIKADPNYHERLMKYLNSAKKVLLEGSQGCDLDLNHSGHYPYVTSRQISVAQMCADSGASPMRLKEIIMVIRPFPIRISNQTNIGQDIYSGDYGCSEELDWDKIHVGAMMGWYPSTVTAEDIENYKELIDLEKNNPELTTVTIKPRRVFDIDTNQLKKNIQINTPTSIYLNFFQYLGEQYASLTGKYNDICIDKYQREYLNWLEEELCTPITMLGTGEDFREYINRKSYVKSILKK
jgi:adenylosuccinate synthase